MFDDMLNMDEGAQGVTKSLKKGGQKLLLVLAFAGATTWAATRPQVKHAFRQTVDNVTDFTDKISYEVNNALAWPTTSP